MLRSSNVKDISKEKSLKDGWERVGKVVEEMLRTYAIREVKETAFQTDLKTNT